MSATVHTSAPTQVRNPWRATIRTLFQLLVSLAATWGLIVEAAGIDQTAAWVSGTLAFSAAVTRIMALPAVESLLRQFVPWLAATSPLEAATLDDDLGAVEAELEADAAGDDLDAPEWPEFADTDQHDE